MSTLGPDLRFGMRMLLKTPGLSAVAVLTIALGVGLTTHAYSALDGTVLRGLPVPDQERLMNVTERIDRLDVTTSRVPIADLVDLRERQTPFEELAAYAQLSVNLAGEEAPPERIAGALVSANALSVLGVQPLMGRVFVAGEDAPDATPRIVLSYPLWQNRFGADRDIVGRTVRANGQAAEVVGVMPEGFHFPFREAAWMPLRLDPDTEVRRAAFVDVFGRLREGVSREAALASLEGVARDLERIHPEENEGVRFEIRHFAERFMPPQITSVMFLMLAATFGVLLIACANVANILLARASVRGREVAVRIALGASRLRVMRQLLGESFVLAVVGGALGVLFAYLGMEAFNAAIADIERPYWIDTRVDGRALAFAVGVTLLASLAAGTLPALRASGMGLGEALRDETRGSTSGRLSGLSTALVVGEVAVSCGLLVAAGLMIKSVVNVASLDPGFDPERVLTGRVALDESGYATAEERRALFEALEERLEAEPGVATAVLATALPALGGSEWAVTVEGRTYPTDRDVPVTYGAVVTRGFFETMGVELVRGRDFEHAEVWDASEPVAIVNESFARRIVGDADPIGARVRLGRSSSTYPWMRIVGVSPDLHVGGGVGGIGDDLLPPQYLYLTPAVLPRQAMVAAVRTEGPPASLAPRLRAIVSELDPNLPVDALRTMPDAIRSSTWAFGFFGSLFTIFGLAALFMAAVGLYGVMAFSVAQRRQEMGVRMALGARPADIRGMVLGRGVRQLAAGTVVGLALGLLIAKPLSFVTYGVTLADPFLYAFIVATLGSAGLVACLVPARAATRADPVAAMRPQ
ncbi:MAG TPA: ABC transporter permease [Longimicrobiales bacterium]|nr:ABC transporter permease [Longimicrobiales bacterium]